MGVNTRNMQSCLQKCNKLNKSHLVGQLLNPIHEARTHVYKLRELIRLRVAGGGHVALMRKENVYTGLRRGNLSDRNTIKTFWTRTRGGKLWIRQSTFTLHEEQRFLNKL